MTSENSRESIIQNLKDADCEGQLIEQFLSAVDSGNTQKALLLLAQHRETLLQQFHKCDNCICCLDYLVFRLKRELGEEY